MATVISNEKQGRDFFLLKVDMASDARAGQFYMLRAWDAFPTLSRPISVFDSDGGSLSFLCRIVGIGTEILSRLSPGDELSLQGPLGVAFPAPNGRVALVGGGVGVAPLHLAAKQIRPLNLETPPDIYLGFSDEAVMADAFKPLAGKLSVDVGGFITDSIEPAAYDSIFACGPEVMLRALHDKCVKAGRSQNLWVSMEGRMACGIGACLVCSCPTADGNRKICKDGPVFKSSQVFGIMGRDDNGR
jgi:dihydroorotate dehydrogenase electron transfer subunit